MYKKIIAIILSAMTVFSCTSVFGESTGEPLVYNLSLDEAIKMAVNNSPELQCWDINMQNYKVQLEGALRAKKQNKDTTVYVNQNFELAYVKNGYYVDAARSQIRLANIEYDKIINTISYNVTQKYFNAKNALKMCDISSSALKRATENNDIILQKYNSGACTALDVKNAEITVMQCEANLNKSQNSYTLALDSLKIALGIESDPKIFLTDEIYTDSLEADLESDTKNAMKTRYDVNALKEAADLSGAYFKVASSLSSKSTTYFSAYTNSITSKYNFDTGVKNIKLLIKQSYFSVKEAERDSEIAKQKLDYTKNTYEVNKLRYDMGMITASTLSALSDELASAEITYENALLAQRLATEKYSYEIAAGI